MNRKEFARRVASLMREKDIRKPVSVPKQVLHISDDEGNARDFVVRKTDKSVQFTIEDVEAMLDSIIYVIEDSLKHGEEVSIRGFGTLGLHYRKSRKLKHVGTGEDTVAEARYIPKFAPGHDLRLSAKMYELSLSDVTEPLPVYSDDEYDEEDGD